MRFRAHEGRGPTWCGDLVGRRAEEKAPSAPLPLTVSPPPGAFGAVSTEPARGPRSVSPDSSPQRALGVEPARGAGGDVGDARGVPRVGVGELELVRGAKRTEGGGAELVTRAGLQARTDERLAYSATCRRRRARSPMRRRRRTRGWFGNLPKRRWTLRLASFIRAMVPSVRSANTLSTNCRSSSPPSPPRTPAARAPASRPAPPRRSSIASAPASSPSMSTSSASSGAAGPAAPRVTLSACSGAARASS
jgi:hypothetical protein